MLAVSVSVKLLKHNENVRTNTFCVECNSIFDLAVPEQPHIDALKQWLSAFSQDMYVSVMWCLQCRFLFDDSAKVSVIILSSTCFVIVITNAELFFFSTK